MAVTLRFCDWQRPFLHNAADILLAEAADTETLVDLSEVITVVPGAAAGRRLIELLVARSEANSRVLLPPRVITPGMLPELFYAPKAPTAEIALRLSLRATLLSKRDPEELKALLPLPPASDDFNAWFTFAQTIESLSQELSGAAIEFAEVARLIEEKTDLPDDPRWMLLHDIESEFKAALREQQLFNQRNIVGPCRATVCDYKEPA